MNGIRDSIRKHPIGAYLVILYPLSLLFNLPALLGKEGFGVISADIPFFLGILPSTILGLAGLAFLITRITDGKAGTRELLRRFYAFRAGPQWYVLAIFLAPALLLVVSLFMHGGAALSPLKNHTAEIVTAYLQTLVTFAILINLCEEAGWMAFVTTRLQRRWGALRACVAVGPLMGLIHVPLIFVTGAVAAGGGRIQPKDYALAFFVLLVGYAIPFRIIVTWVYNSTGASLPIVALLHSSFDTLASAAVLTTFFSGVDPIWIDIIPAPVALAIIVLTRGRLGYRRETTPLPEPAQAVSNLSTV
jgi:CAAX protease family protein